MVPCWTLTSPHPGTQDAWPPLSTTRCTVHMTSLMALILTECITFATPGPNPCTAPLHSPCPLILTRAIGLHIVSVHHMSFPVFLSIHATPHLLCPCPLPPAHALPCPCAVPCLCMVHVVTPSHQEVKSSHIQLQSPSDSISVIITQTHSFSHACPQISDGFVRQGVIGFYFSSSESFLGLD